MEFWTNLGIEKTKDENAIQEAYHKKLPLVNPEDKPEEFKALRAEYEEALRYARTEETPEEEAQTPVQRWVSRLDEIYTHIGRRCDPEAWRELLADPLCEGLDSRAEVQDAMLTYFLDHWHLPQEIWQLLDGAFDLRGQKEDLLEKYPTDFVENAVIGGIEESVFLPYDLFLPQNTGDVDPYFALFFKTRDLLNEGELDSAEASLADLEATGIDHPFTELLRLRLAYNRSESEAADDELTQKVRALHERFPDNTEFTGFYADVISNRGEDEEAIPLYESILEKEPKNHNMRYHLAQSLMKLGRYKEAKKKFSDLYADLPYHEAVQKGMKEANDKLEAQYAAVLEEHPDDIETRMEYAWCLFQNDRMDEAKAVIDVPAPEPLDQRADYENLCSKLCQSTCDNEAALRHAQAWREVVKQLPEGETEEEKKRKNKLGDIAFVEAAVLYQMERYAECVQKTEEALSYDPTEYRALQVRYRACIAMHDDEGALRAGEELVRVKPFAMTYFFLGCAQYRLEKYPEAFDSFGRSLEYTREATCYFYRARILCRYDEFDRAQEIVDLLKENNIESDSMRYIESLLLMERDQKEDEAMAIWQDIVDRDEKDETDCELLWEVYTDLVVYKLRHDAEPREVLALIERGLQKRSDYPPLLINKGIVLDEKLNEHEQGLAVYRQVYESCPGHYTVRQRMASIYYYDLHDLQTAKKYYLEQETVSDNAFCQLMLGNTCSALNEFEEAETHFKNAIGLDENYERAYRDYAAMLERSRQFDRALEMNRKVVEMVGERSGFARRNEARVLAHLGRYAEAADIHVALYGQFQSAGDLDKAADLLLVGNMPDRLLKLLEQYKKEMGENYFDQLAEYYKYLGDDRKCLRAIRSLSDDNANKLRRLANYEFSHGHYRKALEFIQAYYAKEPDSVMDRYLPIACCRRLGQTDRLDALYDEGLRVMEQEIMPWNSPLLLTKKAYMLIAMGRMEEARQCIDEALSSPACEFCHHMGCIDGYDVLSYYYEVTGDYNASARTCLEALKISPLDPEIHERLRRLRKEHKKELNKEYLK